MVNKEISCVSRMKISDVMSDHTVSQIRALLPKRKQKLSGTKSSSCSMDVINTIPGKSSWDSDRRAEILRPAWGGAG